MKEETVFIIIGLIILMVIVLNSRKRVVKQRNEILLNQTQGSTAINATSNLIKCEAAKVNKLMKEVESIRNREPQLSDESISKIIGYRKQIEYCLANIENYIKQLSEIDRRNTYVSLSDGEKVQVNQYVNMIHYFNSNQL